MYTITLAVCIGITFAAGALISPVLTVQPFQGPPLTLKAFATTAMAGLGSVKGPRQTDGRPPQPRWPV